MSFSIFIILTLAAFRVSRGIASTTEVGPWNVLSKIREKAGVKYDGLGRLQTEAGTLADGLMCVYCNSVWIGFIFAGIFACLLLAVPAKLACLPFLPLAISGGIIVINDAHELIIKKRFS